MAIDTNIYNQLYYHTAGMDWRNWMTAATAQNNSSWVNGPVTSATADTRWTFTIDKYYDLLRQIRDLETHLETQKREEPKDEEVDDEALCASMNEMFEDIFADEDAE